MDIQQAKYVLELAKHRNFTRAANALYISQPTLSAQITSVEKELGVKLFKRTTRAVLLTDRGKLFCDKVQPILDAWDKLMSVMQLYREYSAPPICIGFTFRAHSNSILKQCLTFFENNQKYHGSFIDVTMSELVSKLRSCELDVAFSPIFSREDFEKNFPDLEAVPLTKEQNCVLMGNHYPLTEKRSMKLEDLQNQTFIIGLENLHEDRHLQQLEREFSIHPGEIIRTNSLEITIGLLRAGKGITLGSSSFAKTYNLTAVPLEPERYSSLCYLYKSDTQNQAVLDLKLFLSEAKEYL